MESGEMNFDCEAKIRGYKPNYDPHPIQIKKAAELLVNSERPFILAGGGVMIANACEELRTRNSAR